MGRIEDLPLIIFRLIQEYVSSLEYWQLISTNKRIFHDIKYQTFYISLKGDETKELFNNPLFCMRILRSIAQPSRQLSLTINHLLGINTNLFAQLPFISRLHRLRIEQGMINTVRIFKDIHTVELVSCSRVLTTCDGLTNVKVIKLSQFFNLTDIHQLASVYECCLEGLPLLVDVSPLANVPIVTIKECGSVVDVSCLGNVKKLILDNCPRIQEVNGLGRVNDLELVELDNVTDISGLTNNQKIMIRCCLRIQNFSSLSRCHDVSLSEINNDGITIPINIFQEARSLDLDYIKQLVIPANEEYCPHLEKLVIVSPPANLTVSHCKKLKYLKVISAEFGIENFVNIQTIEFHKCTIKSLLEINPSIVRSITFRSCTGITDFSPLRYVKKVIIDGCSLVNATDLSHVEDLTIKGYKGAHYVTNLSDLSAVKRLRLENVSMSDYIDCKFPDAPDITLVHCTFKKNVTISSKNQRVTIIDSSDMYDRHCIDIHKLLKRNGFKLQEKTEPTNSTFKTLYLKKTGIRNFADEEEDEEEKKVEE